MDDNKAPGKTPAQTPESISAKERVGEMLRSERERRGISIYVIAKDLRLNPRFIEALEANDYDLLPGDTYIRVYLKSLCKYFSLNADELLERFFKERGVSGVDTLRKDSSTKINIAALREKEKPNKTVILAASFFIILALLSYIATRQGWFSPETVPSVPVKVDSASLQYQNNDSANGIFAETPDTVQSDSLANDSINFEDTAFLTTTKAKKDTVSKDKAEKESIKDSTRIAKAKARIIKDSILKAEAKSRIIKDSILKAEAKNRIIKDSILKAEAKSRIIKDSILKAEAKSRIIKDSILKTEAKNRIIKDSILKAEAKSRIIKDSILKAEAKSRIIKDSIFEAEEKNKLVLEEIQKAQVKARVIKDSVLKAEAKNKAVRDSVLKADARNKNSKKDTLKPGTAVAAPAPVGQIMELKLEVTGNSAWARVLRDGVPWRNILKKGSKTTFTAKDSFNIRTGQLEDVVLTLNGNKLTVPSTGIIVLKIDHSGPIIWTDEQWFKLTKGRF